MINHLAARPGVVSRRRAPSLSRAGVLGAVGLTMAPAAVVAAERPVEAAPLSSVTVTAAKSGFVANRSAKLAADLRDVPQSVTVLNKALLASQGVTSLSEALKNVPGITIGGAEGGQIGNNINLNGFTARTDIYLDGLRDRGQYYRDTFDLDSVEVLMGPSSMLFGRGSTGGAVNQVSKRPRPTPFTEAAASVTSNGLTRVTADINAPLSKLAGLRLAAMAQEGSVSTREQTRVRDQGVAASYLWGMDAPTQIIVSGLVQHNDDRPDYGVSPLNGRPAKVGFDAVYGYSDDRTVQDIAAVTGEIRRDFASGLTVRNQLQFNRVDTDARESASQGAGLVGPKGFVAFTPAGISPLPLGQMWVRLQSHDRVIHDTSLFNQTEVSGRFATGSLVHTALAGAEFGKDRYRNQGYGRTGVCNAVALPSGYEGCVPLLDPPYAASPATVSAAGNLASGVADTAAVYVNDAIDLNPALKLVAGVRYDRYAAVIANSLNSANTPGNTSFARLAQTVTHTSVRLGVLWKPAQAQSYYASYSTSFNPSLEQLTSTTGLSQPLPPQTDESYEVGAKWSLSKGRLDLSAAAFQITQDNARSQNADNTYTADGQVRVRGLRLGVAGKPTRRWEVFGGYAHLDAEIVKAIAVGTQGRVPANTPKDAATLWSTYQAARHWEVGGGASYMSARFLNNTDLVAVPAFVRWDAMVAYRQPRFDVRLNLFNLFDARYYDSLIPSDGGRAVPGAGRTAMLSLVFRP